MRPISITETYCRFSQLDAIEIENMEHNWIYVILISVLANCNSQSLLAPKLVPVLNHRTQAVNTYFQILCSVLEGSKPLFFEWSRNGQSIRSGPAVKHRIDNSEMFSTFIIESVEKIDAGNYSCLVKNAVGSDSQSVLLIVKGKGFFQY